jgi:hypothetical protein
LLSDAYVFTVHYLLNSFEAFEVDTLLGNRRIKQVHGFPVHILVYARKTLRTTSDVK